MIEPFIAAGEGEISLSEDQRVYVLPADVERGWAYVVTEEGTRGYAPADMLIEPSTGATPAETPLVTPRGSAPRGSTVPLGGNRAGAYGLRDPGCVSA